MVSEAMLLQMSETTNTGSACLANPSRNLQLDQETHAVVPAWIPSMPVSSADVLGSGAAALLAG